MFQVNSRLAMTLQKNDIDLERSSTPGSPEPGWLEASVNFTELDFSSPENQNHWGWVSGTWTSVQLLSDSAHRPDLGISIVGLLFLNLKQNFAYFKTIRR